MPKARRHGKRLAPATNPGGPVGQLLQRCEEVSRAPRIVGIDLTGSEKRATGWALMAGADTVTKSLSTDDQLFAETVAAAPDLVSIDSPLSLPEGWTDPNTSCGNPIYRKCELALKRMGISVFWCLLPTMKGLTTRGMRLTQRFRTAGLKVIESYPGAAQDLLGIPRKGSSLEELKWGLSRAGHEGEFLHGKVTHDEVDAITSALVGLFYLADDYIALGNAAEDYLIVPRSLRINYRKLSDILAATGLDEIPMSAVDSLNARSMRSHNTQQRQGNRLVIGIAGRIGSGKSLVAQHLALSCGFQYLRYSLVLALWHDIEPNDKARLQEVGWMIMSKPGGQDELNRPLIAQVKEGQDCVIDGLRHPTDLESLTTAFGSRFFLIYIDTPRAVRFERVCDRYSSYEDFMIADSRPVEGNIECFKPQAAAKLIGTIPREQLLWSSNRFDFRFSIGPFAVAEATESANLVCLTQIP